MSRYAAVAVSDRDGHGHPLAVEVAADLRHNVRILGPDGSVVGEAMADGTVYWEPPMSLRGERVAPASVRHSLAANGRLSAAVDERGVVLCIRAEYRSGSTPSLSGADHRHPRQSGEEFEYFERPGRILSVGGRQHLHGQDDV